MWGNTCIFLEKNPTTNLIYICEKKSKIRKNNKSKFKNVKWVEDENIIFKDKNIDLVVIAHTTTIILAK